MKKRLICCGALSMTLLLFCGTALATDPQVTPVNSETVQVERISKGDDAAFQVTKSVDVTSGQLYLIMIQEGDDASEKPKPTKDNLYYMDVQAAEGSALSLEAYPKELQPDSSYVVYLSDYSEDSNGAAKGVAVISTKAGGDTGDSGDSGDSDTGDSGDSGDSDTGDSGDSGGGSTTEYECGDVNHSGGKPDNRDVRDLARYVGEWPDYMEGGSKAIDLSLADVNGSGGNPDNRDVRDLARYVGEWPDYPSLPHTR